VPKGAESLQYQLKMQQSGKKQKEEKDAKAVRSRTDRRSPQMSPHFSMSRE